MSIKYTLQGALRSLTIWFNAVIGSALAIVPILQDSLPDLQTIISPAGYKSLAAVLVIGNLLLRIKTKYSLADKAP